MFKQGTRGFTVLEMMIVVILMGIIGTAAIPSIGLIRRHEVRKLAKEMCLDLTAQRMRAMAVGKADSTATYVLELVEALETGHYYSYKLTPSLDIASGQARDENKDNSRNIHIMMEALYMKELEGEIDVIEPIYAIQFDNYGSMLNVNTLSSKEIETLTIKITYDLEEARVVFNGVTGHYSIH